MHKAPTQNVMSAMGPGMPASVAFNLEHVHADQRSGERSRKDHNPSLVPRLAAPSFSMLGGSWEQGYHKP